MSLSMRHAIRHPSAACFVFFALWLCIGQACGPAALPCDATRPCNGGLICQDGYCACPEAMARCGDACVDLRSDTSHCGACDSACKSGWRCLQGTCLCEAGRRACGDTCADLASDPNHCGRCGNVCKDGQRCSQGTCVSECPADAPTACPQSDDASKVSCANTSKDPNHCGKCGSQCRSDQLCLAGLCECAPAWRTCGEGKDARCVDPMSDPKHCGKCGNACAANQYCASGRCVAECPTSTPTQCFGGCFDLQANRNHCGACGNTCRLDQTCLDGKCACPPGAVACNGRCVDLRTTFEHCGACGYACQKGQSCSQGQCLRECPKAAPDRCFGGCFDFQSNPNHCGTCGNACAPGQSCTSGKCQCPAGLLLCDGSCIDPKRQPIHCGKCDTVCTGSQVCTDGKCDTSCKSDDLTCKGACHDPSQSQDHCGKCGNACLGGQTCQGSGTKSQCACPSALSLCGGACIDTNTDRLHCGACGKLCGNGEQCQQGKCILSCGDLTACGTLCADLDTDASHCGACGNQCQAGQICAAGTCQCPQGRTLCGGVCVDTNADRNHCGQCGNTCQNAQVCQQGTCQFLCPDQSLQACGKLCVDLNTDPAHCGACDNACGQTQVCQSKTCTCPSNKTACQQDCIDTQTDVSHCGACGNKCATGQFCDQGQCKTCSSAAPIQCGKTCCRTGQTCCNGACIDQNTDVNHCGACGKACSKGQVCIGGACACKPGTTRACYTGPAATRSKGACADGTQTCNAGTWGTCTGEKTPQKETCDGVDNDCDGQTDEDFPTKGNACSAGTGACQQKGQLNCSSDGTRVSCSATATAPSKELCDGKDNDCDGQTDEDLTQTCYTGPAKTQGVGECKAGTQACTNGSWGACKGEVTPQKDACDKLDNDCDGQTDEDCQCTDGQTQACGSNVGACKAGTQTCKGGKWGTCAGQVTATKETCNGADDDCDGKVDNGLTAPPCAKQQGVCQGATQRCAANSKGVVQWLPCTTADYTSHSKSYQPKETGCDNLDNDCDGTIDGSLSRACYTGPSSTRNKGACKDGTQTCSAGKWSLCAGEVKPNSEQCDNIDNNCDGSIDEGLTQGCYTGPSGTAGKGICKAGNRTCSAGKWGTCQGEVVPKKETCNGIDDNCDGAIDEKLTQSCYSGPSGTDKNAPCKAGTQTCGGGVWGTCVGQVLPKAESCDGVDNDCDGAVDDGISCSCKNGQTQACGSDVGECKKGTQTCSSGKWGSCIGEIKDKPEICDGKDNDCDGTTDEGLTQACYTGPSTTRNKGVCRDGTQTCSAGRWGACTGQILPSKETCNNKDDDCDGSVDEGLTQGCYTGPTGTQGTGACKAGTQTCSAGAWGSCVGQVLPQPETCNGTDDDCDGSVDENVQRSCYTGPKGTAGTGLCKAGTQTCRTGTWSACVGQILPKAETCNGEDDDCNGKDDDGISCSCQNGQTQSCGSDVGECKKGTKTCQNGQWGSCIGEIRPTNESCDGKDNDCDGQIDEGLTQGCYTGPAGTLGVGPCRAGTQTCSNGSWGSCQGQVTPRTETCDGVDNDCDGAIDEKLSQSCYTGPSGTQGTGICKAGNQTCSNGTWGTCIGQVTPGTEVCNNQDDDCDGAIDDGVQRSCYTGPKGTAGTGLCKAGTQTCSAGAWGSCKGQILPKAEVCDGKDNNCDGAIDEGLTQGCYTGPTGTQGIGICKAGTQTCKGGSWGTCTGQVLPKPEICNGIDDNCNRSVDDGISCVCQEGDVQSCGSDVGECKAGQQTCKGGNWGSCIGEIKPTPEVCDGKDNDCDGKPDEGLTQSCYTGPTGTRNVGICKDGTQACSGGTWGTCTGQITPGREVCNGADDDCDGSVDENITRGCYTGPTGTAGQGECKAGTQTCSNGGWGSCVGQVLPKTESCDGKDNDCDGKIDESLTQSCYTGPKGTKGVGECRAGTQVCTGGRWGSCVGQVLPEKETCDGKDNDCDGIVDNIDGSSGGDGGKDGGGKDGGDGSGCNPPR